MSILAKNETGGGDFYRIPPGTYIGRCFWVIDMGTYPTEFQGQKRNRHEVRLTWEIPDEQIERDGVVKPAAISKTYTLSLNEKAALRHDLEAWRGRAFTDEELKGFDLAKLLGIPCTLTIADKKMLDGNTRPSVSAVGKLGKGMQCGPAFNKQVEYSVAMGKGEVYLGLPDWLKEKLSKCLEWTAPAPDVQQPADEAPTATPEEVDVPF